MASTTKAPPTEPGRRAHCEDHPTCEYRLSAIEESRACSVREHADIYNEIKKKMSASLSVTLMGALGIAAMLFSGWIMTKVDSAMETLHHIDRTTASVQAKVTSIDSTLTDHASRLRSVERMTHRDRSSRPGN
jgi:hypothetical protein